MAKRKQIEDMFGNPKLENKDSEKEMLFNAGWKAYCELILPGKIQAVNENAKAESLFLGLTHYRGLFNVWYRKVIQFNQEEK
ncbi:MAG: hypothetical protein DRH26_01340 [Deltaproteobacteria bacterium]|nr:MAG: hypothetical protein DRH26_01340 [Deltaproteobacteria bacterium]